MLEPDEGVPVVYPSDHKQGVVIACEELLDTHTRGTTEHLKRTGWVVPELMLDPLVGRAQLR